MTGHRVMPGVTCAGFGADASTATAPAEIAPHDETGPGETNDGSPSDPVIAHRDSHPLPRPSQASVNSAVLHGLQTAQWSTQDPRKSALFNPKSCAIVIGDGRSKYHVGWWSRPSARAETAKSGRAYCRQGNISGPDLLPRIWQSESNGSGRHPRRMRPALQTSHARCRHHWEPPRLSAAG
jgi:hypothetical protein